MRISTTQLTQPKECFRSCGAEAPTAPAGTARCSDHSGGGGPAAAVRREPPPFMRCGVAPVQNGHGALLHGSRPPESAHAHRTLRAGRSSRAPARAWLPSAPTTSGRLTPLSTVCPRLLRGVVSGQQTDCPSYCRGTLGVPSEGCLAGGCYGRLCAWLGVDSPFLTSSDSCFHWQRAGAALICIFPSTKMLPTPLLRD